MGDRATVNRGVPMVDSGDRAGAVGLGAVWVASEAAAAGLDEVASGGLAVGTAGPQAASTSATVAIARMPGRRDGVGREQLAWVGQNVAGLEVEPVEQLPGGANFGGILADADHFVSTCSGTRNFGAPRLTIASATASS